MDITTLVGMRVHKIENSGDSLAFHCSNGRSFKLYHAQDCCEDVRLEDVVGDLDDLLGAPILTAESVSSDDTPNLDNSDSYTWTFYKLATFKGSVTLRWYGSSNGYYSESVDFTEIT